MKQMFFFRLYYKIVQYLKKLLKFLLFKIRFKNPFVIIVFFFIVLFLPLFMIISNEMIYYLFVVFILLIIGLQYLMRHSFMNDVLIEYDEEIYFFLQCIELYVWIILRKVYCNKYRLFLYECMRIIIFFICYYFCVSLSFYSKKMKNSNYERIIKSFFFFRYASFLSNVY